MQLFARFDYHLIYLQRERTAFTIESVKPFRLLLLLLQKQVTVLIVVSQATCANAFHSTLVRGSGKSFSTSAFVIRRSLGYYCTPGAAAWLPRGFEGEHIKAWRSWKVSLQCANPFVVPRWPFISALRFLSVCTNSQNLQDVIVQRGLKSKDWPHYANLFRFARSCFGAACPDF